MIIFPGKADHTIKDLTALDNLCIVTQEKGLDGRTFDDGMAWKNMADVRPRKNKRNRFSQVLNGNWW